MNADIELIKSTVRSLWAMFPLASRISVSSEVESSSPSDPTHLWVIEVGFDANVRPCICVSDSSFTVALAQVMSRDLQEKKPREVARFRPNAARFSSN